MSGNSFTVEINLIDRNDLSIYEKMCSIVLARYAGRTEFSNMLNTRVIALRMGCTEAEAEAALSSLIEKNLITLEDPEHIEPDLLVEPVKVNSKVIRSEVIAEEQAKESVFSHLERFEEEVEVEAPKPKRKKAPAKAKKSEPVEKKAEAKAKTPEVLEEEDLEVLAAVRNLQAQRQSQNSGVTSRPVVPKQVREDVQDLINQIFEIVDENINDREARIILSFANNDVELIREKYRVAKRSQLSDKIEVLINELQRRELDAEGMASVEKSKIDLEQPPKHLEKAQVDLDNLNRMVAFKQSSYGKQKK